LGYDLHEPLPDHSSLTRIRERYGLPIFRHFFKQVVELCAEAGLVRGEVFFFDSTKVEANAAVDALAPRWAVEAHLGGIFSGTGSEEDGPATGETSLAANALPMAEDPALQVRNAAEND
jgi:hypothetical protein